MSACEINANECNKKISGYVKKVKKKAKCVTNNLCISLIANENGRD
jgi:hypothetical protein